MFTIMGTIFLFVNLILLAEGAHAKDPRDSKEGHKDTVQQQPEYNPLGALVR
jgi:hypothetical protein